MAVATGSSPAQGELAGLAEAVAAKEAGNAALKSADLPLAVERYEEAIKTCDHVLASLQTGRVEPKELRNNDLVRYEHQGHAGFAIVDMAYPQFGDYVLQDLGNLSIVKVKAGKYEEVSRKFRRKELLAVPRELFDTRLACLQNLTLVSLKLAKVSARDADFEETVKRADHALSMDGRAAKALMRKGACLLALRRVPEAVKALTAASQETRGKDPEVERLLEAVMQAKGKGKAAKAKGKGKAPIQEDDFAGYSSDSDTEAFRPTVRPGEDDDMPLVKEARPCELDAPVPAALRERKDDDDDDDDDELMIEEVPRDDGERSGGASDSASPSAAPPAETAAKAAARSSGQSGGSGPAGSSHSGAAESRWPQKAFALIVTAVITIGGVSAVLMRSAIWEALHSDAEGAEL